MKGSKEQAVLLGSNKYSVLLNDEPVPSSIYTLSLINKELRKTIQLSVIIVGKNKQAATTAMVDSGASTIFLNKKFVEEYDVCTTELPRPIMLRNTDNSDNAIGQITYEAHLNLKIEEHEEEIVIAIADIGDNDLILGVDWL